MKITLDIDEDTLRDAIGSARIHYWAELVEWNRVAMRLEIDEHVGEHCAPIRHLLTPDDFARGASILAQKYPGAFVDFINRTGDLLIQCAAFGEERYA